jgi:hypothetical protein
MAQLATIVDDGNYIRIPEWGIDINKTTIREIRTKQYSAIVKTLDDNVYSLDSREFVGFPDGSTLASTLLDYANNLSATPAAPPSYNNVIRVDPQNGDFPTLEEAMESITDSSSTNRYLVLMSPYVYNVNNPIPGKTHVTIQAEGVRSVVLQAANANEDMFVGGNFFYLHGLIMQGVSGASNYIINNNDAGRVVLLDCVIKDCSNGVLGNDVNSVIESTNTSFNTTTTPMQTAVKMQAGLFTGNIVKVRPTAQISDLLVASGVNSDIEIIGLSSSSPNVGNALTVSGGALCGVTSANILYCQNGIIVDGTNTRVFVNNANISVAVDGVRAEATAANSVINLGSCTISGAGNLNFNVLSPTCTVTGNVFTEIDSMYIHPDAEFYAQILDTTEGDEGLYILGQASVGSVLRPGEFCVGSGDSHTHMKVVTYDGTSVYTDVTTEAKSTSGSLFSFPNVNTGAAIYVGSEYLDHKFPGIKSLLDTAAVVGAGTIDTQIWNGTSWVTIHIMETESFGNFRSLSNKIFTGAPGSYHTYFNSIDVGETGSWTKNNPLSGTPLDDLTERYWVRFIITASITTAPVFQRFKLHSDRLEINEARTVQKFGNYRDSVKKRLITKVEGLAGFVPTTININYASGITAVAQLAELGNNTRAGIVVTGEIEPGADTSTPLELVITYNGTSALAGNVSLAVSGVVIGANDKRDGTIVPTTSQELISIGANESFEGKTTIFYFDINEAEERDTFVLSIYRDSRPSNESDTYDGSVVLEDVYVESSSWKL